MNHQAESDIYTAFQELGSWKLWREGGYVGESQGVAHTWFPEAILKEDPDWVAETDLLSQSSRARV